MNALVKRLVLQQKFRTFGITRRKTSLAIVGLVIGTLVLAACGSADPSSSASSSAPTSNAASTSAAATGKPIAVGMICDCSGVNAASVASEAKGYQAFVDSVNARGGIKSHPIKFILKDTGSNPGTAVTAFQELVAAKVVAIVNDTNYDSGFAAAVQAAKIPVIGSLASSASMYQNPNFYPSAQTQDSATYAVVDTAKSAGGTNVGVLYCAEAPVCKELVPLVKSAGQQAGIPLAFSAAVSSKATNYTAVCVAAKQANVTTLAVFTPGYVVPRIAKDCAQQGYNPKYVTQGQGMSPTLLNGGVQKLYSEYEVYPYWTKSPATDAMNAALDKYLPGVRSDVNVWNQQGVEGWTAGLLLEEAVKASKLTADQEPTAAAIVAGLESESLQGTTLGGMTPPLYFPAGKAHPQACWFTASHLNNTPSLTNGGKPTCRKAAAG